LVELGPLESGSLIFDSSQWLDRFRDFIDGGFNDGSAEGFRLPEGSTESLPWVGIDRIKLPFNFDVGESLGADDFQLDVAWGADGEAVTTTAPNIVDVTWDPATMTATLQLDGGMGPGEYTLTTLAAAIESRGGKQLAADQSSTFFVLPGDAVDQSEQFFGVYGVDEVDLFFIREHRPGFLVDLQGDHPFDGSYFGYELRADINGDGWVNSFDATLVRDNQIGSHVVNFARTVELWTDWLTRSFAASSRSTETIATDTVDSQTKVASFDTASDETSRSRDSASIPSAGTGEHEQQVDAALADPDLLAANDLDSFSTS